MAEHVKSEGWTGVAPMPTIREAIAVFDDPEQLQSAISELQSRGVDRSDLSFLAHQSLIEGRHRSPQDLGVDPATRRDAPVTDVDLAQGRVLGTSLAATVAALIAAGFVVATGGLAAAAIAAAAAAGGAGAAGALIGGKLTADEEAFIDAQLARGGVVLWVRLRDAAAERGALEVLRRRASEMRVRELSQDASPAPRETEDGGTQVTKK